MFKLPKIKLSSRRVIFTRASPQCYYSSQHQEIPSDTQKARLNAPINYERHALLHQSPKAVLEKLGLPQNTDITRQNLFTAINAAIADALRSDKKVLVFGEDITFGGVFRCTQGLSANFGPDRVFNTPLTEQGIAGFAIGAAAQGLRPIAEIQFADYVFPAFDQLINEAAKWRYREGATGNHVGGLVMRMPCGSVGHGALYHSQSPEALFTHVPGLRVVMPRSPIQAKGLLLSSIFCNDPVIFLEPKILYRAAVEQVPAVPFQLPLSEAEVLKRGKDVTIISYGQPLYLCSTAIAAAERDFEISVELLDLQTLYPWDRATVYNSVRKTGRAIIVHESMSNAGIGAEVAASIQQEAFLSLDAPILRIAGASTHSGLVYEKFNIPDVTRIYDGIRKIINY